MSETGPGVRVARAIAAYAPVSLSAEARAFARAVVRSAEPGTVQRAKALLFAAARLARFGESVGLELSPGVLLHRSVIERFVLVGCSGFSPATRRTLRTNLRALARAGETRPQPEAVPLPRERAKRPYREAEIAGYLALAGAQGTERRRMRCLALVCLGAGAGLVGRELRHLRGSDVIARSGGLLVVVGGARARAVPVLERFHRPLEQAAAFAGERYLLGGSAPDRKNLTDALTVALCQDAGLPRLEAGRLRATWLVACAERIGLGAFMHAAGISCSQRLGDLISYLPPLPNRTSSRCWERARERGSRAHRRADPRRLRGGRADRGATAGRGRECRRNRVSVAERNGHAYISYI
jgi:integrase